MSSRARFIRLTPSPFEGLKELGQGGAGEVFLARAPSGELVAIKRLLGTSSEENAARLARFERERELLEGLREVDGVVSLLGYGSDRFGPYLILPYLSGGDLRQRIERGDLPHDEIPALALRLAEILEGAHAYGVIHRDVKPENVLFDDKGEACLTDFGIGRSTRATGAVANLTQSDQMLGSCDYMAPEQLSNARNVRPSADIYSWAAIIYELYSGHRPFEGVTVAELLAQLVSADVEPLLSIAPETPPAIAELVDRCLSRDPAARPQDGSELAQDLRFALRADTKTSQRPAIALALTAIGLTLGALYGLVPSKPPPPLGVPHPKAIPTTTPPAAPAPPIKARALSAAGPETHLLELVDLRGGIRGRHHTMVSGLHVDVERGIVLSAALDGEVAAWSLESGDPVWIRRADRGATGVIRMDPIPGRPQVVLSGWHQPVFEVIDLRDGRRIGVHRLENREGGLYACPTKDGRIVVLHGFEMFCFRDDGEGRFTTLWTRAWPLESGLGKDLSGLIIGETDFTVSTLTGELARLSLDSGELLAQRRTVAGAHRLRWLGAGSVLAVLGAGGKFALHQPGLEPIGEYLGCQSDRSLGHVRDVLDLSDRYFLLTGDDFKVHVWDLQQRELSRSLAVTHGNSWIQCLSIADGRRLVTCGNDGSVRLWDRESAQELWKRDWVDVPPETLSSSLHGRVIAVNHRQSRSLGIWQEGAGWKYFQFDSPPEAVAACEDPPQVAAYYKTFTDQRLVVVDLNSDKLISGGQVPEPVSATADGELLAIVQAREGLRVLELKSGEMMHGEFPLESPLHIERLSATELLACSEKGRVALVGRESVSLKPELSRGILGSSSRQGDSWLRVRVQGEVEALSRYELQSGKPLGTVHVVEGKVRGIAALPPYLLLLSSAGLEIRSFESGDLITTLRDSDFDQGLGTPISISSWVTLEGRSQVALGMSKGPILILEAR